MNKSSSPTCLSYENENNPENTCDSWEAGISQTLPIFHHLLLKNYSQVVQITTGREKMSSALVGFIPHRHFTAVTLGLYIKQRIKLFLLCRVLHVDLAIWTLEEKTKEINVAKRLRVEEDFSHTETETWTCVRSKADWGSKAYNISEQERTGGDRTQHSRTDDKTRLHGIGQGRIGLDRAGHNRRELRAIEPRFAKM